MKTDTPISAYILCGGKSSRMGTDKGFVRFRNRTFTDWCLEAAREITDVIYLVTSNKKYARFGYPLLEDICENKGPVGGIYTALENSDTDWNMILSCDIPGITGSVLSDLVERTSGQASVAFLSHAAKDYPLIALYHKNCKKAFSEAVQKNDLRLMGIIGTLDYERIAVPSSENGSINNINTQKELKELIENTSQI